MPEIYDHLPEWLGKIFESGISAMAIFAVVLDLAFNHFDKSSGVGPTGAVAAGGEDNVVEPAH